MAYKMRRITSSLALVLLATLGSGHAHAQLARGDVAPPVLDTSVHWSYDDPYRSRHDLRFNPGVISQYFEGISPEATVDPRIVNPPDEASRLDPAKQYFFCRLLTDRLEKRYGVPEGPYYDVRYHIRSDEALEQAAKDDEYLAATSWCCSAVESGDINAYAQWASGRLSCPSFEQKQSEKTIQRDVGRETGPSVSREGPQEEGEGVQIAWYWWVIGVFLLIGLIGAGSGSNGGSSSDTDDSDDGSFGGIQTDAQYRVQYTGPGIAGWVNDSSDFSSVSAAIEVCNRRKAADPKRAFRVVEVRSNGRVGSTVYSA